MKTAVDIVVLEGGYVEASALRSTLESFNFQVNLFLIGSPKDFQDLFKKGSNRSEFVVICGHGDSKGFIFEKLEQKIEKGQPWGERLSSDHIAKYLSFSSHILTSCCECGDEEIAKAFLNKNAKSFIGPASQIEGRSVLLYLISFFYYIAQHNADIFKAASFAQNFDQETKLMKLILHK